MTGQAHTTAACDGIAYTPTRAPARAHFAALPRAEVRIAQADDGRWMWGVSYASTTGGFGYAPLPKWNNWAPTREDALRRGAMELREKLVRMRQQSAPAAILDWLETELCTFGHGQLELFALR